jgi:hypothetical protein
MNHQFLVMWCNEGLESVVDITADEQRQIWEKLKGNPSPNTAVPNVNHLILRARYNTQRHYEIYTVEAVEGITADNIRDMFENSPQTAADTIRERGHCIHSDRAESKRVLIT